MRASVSVAGPLGKAEPVTRVVLEDRLDAIRTFGRRRKELHAFGSQLIICDLTVGRIENSGAQISFFDHGSELSGGGFIKHHAGLGLHQYDLEAGLIFWRDCKPAEALHPGIGPNFEAELVSIELERFILIEDI